MTRSTKAITMMIISVICISATCIAATSEILGKWKAQDRDGTIVEFFSDGRVSIQLSEGSDQSMTGSWVILDDGRLKIELSMFGQTVTQVGQLSFVNEEMIIVDSDNTRTRHKRVQPISRDGVVAARVNSPRDAGTSQPVSSFSPNDLKSTQQWADSLKARLGAVAKQGNALVLKEAQDAIRRDVASIVGSSVKWTLHVAAVTENGVAKFSEIFDTESFSAPILSMEQSLTVFFATPPAFSLEELRSFKAGDPVTVMATVKEAALKRDSYGINIVLNVASAEDDDAVTDAPPNNARAEAARSRTSTSDTPAPATAMVTIKNGTISILGLRTGNISVSLDGKYAKVLKAGESFGEALVIGSQHSITATKNGQRIVRNFVVNDGGGEIILTPRDFP